MLDLICYMEGREIELTVAIIDTQGRLYTVESGQFDDRRIDELAARIDGLRRQSLAGPQTTLLPPVR
jgi:hypothetical protein